MAATAGYTIFLFKGGVVFSASTMFVVYQCKNLGDSLLTTPLLNALLRNFEDAHVLVVCKDQSIPIFDRLSDRVQVLERPNTISKWIALFRLLLTKSDRVVLLPHASNAGLALAKLTGSQSICPIKLKHWLIGSVDVSCPVRVSPWRHTAEINLDMLRKIGVIVQKRDKLINVTGILNGSSRPSALRLSSHYVVVHPGSRWMFKSPRYEFWKEVIEKVVSSGYAVVVTGASEGAEGELCRKLGNLVCATNIAGQTSLGELAHLIKRSVGFLGVDTFSMHLAAGLGVPGVVLFGPTSELIWGPYGTNCKLEVITSTHSCRPCHVDGCGGSKVSECLDELDPTQVVASFCRQLERC